MLSGNYLSEAIQKVRSEKYVSSERKGEDMLQQIISGPHNFAVGWYERDALVSPLGMLIPESNLFVLHIHHAYSHMLLASKINGAVTTYQLMNTKHRNKATKKKKYVGKLFFFTNCSYLVLTRRLGSIQSIQFKPGQPTQRAHIL
jgi:hypothetical protein